MTTEDLPYAPACSPKKAQRGSERRKRHILHSRNRKSRDNTPKNEPRLPQRFAAASVYRMTGPLRRRTELVLRQTYGNRLSGEPSAARSDAGPDSPDRLPENGTTQLRGTEQTTEKTAMQKQEPIRMRSPEALSFAEALPGRNLSYGPHFVLPLRSCLLRRAIRTARRRAKHRTTVPRLESMRNPNRCPLCPGSGAGRARSGERDPGPD